MSRSDDLHSAILDILRDRMGDGMDEYAFPPPVFGAMQGEFLEFDLDAGSLSAQFPVLESHLNPFGTMQGGMIAAAVDNTLGPLSVLIAPPSVTRRLEIKYVRPITPDLGSIVVSALLLERVDRWMYFRADVRGHDGALLARAKATHWIVDES